jgi:hypothetical protein
LKRQSILPGLAIVIFIYVMSNINTGCAQIGTPTGGPRDSIAPVLIKATPDIRAVNITGNRISFQFNEYVEVMESQKNVLVSPMQKNSPFVNYNLRNVTVRLRDTLLPNTTYSINFGNAIRDVNEGNVFKDFTYVFSTGNSIDSASISGKVLLAETGLVDSTISVILYRNLADSAVKTLRPDYLARLDGEGNFRFSYLPEGTFKLYALKDTDGNKYYNNKTEFFGFLGAAVNAPDSSGKNILYAYTQEKPRDTKITPVLKKAPEKILKLSTNLKGQQDLLEPLVLNFNNPLRKFDSSRVKLTDTNFVIIPAIAKLDSSSKKVTYDVRWVMGQAYRLIIPKDAIEDSAGIQLNKSDTLDFTTKSESEYARIILRFKNLNLANNPVIQFVQGEEVKFSYSLTSIEWSNKMFPPGEYSIRILNDLNKDGKWTAGDYDKKIQPEIAVTLPQKLSLRANWDNERDIIL